MTKDEALRMALKSLEFYYDLWKEKVDAQTITAIREALAQPEQEPVDSDEKAIAYMANRLWEFVETAGAFPKAKVDSRLWDCVMVFAPKKSEPVAWMCSDFNLMHRGYSRFSPTRQGEWSIPVYTTPPQREWVGLRDSQKLAIIRDCSHLSMMQLIELVEEEIRRNNNA